MTVILKFHQLQHMNGDDFEKISHCVVFDKTKLSKLYTRVGELQEETEEQKIKHKYFIIKYINRYKTKY